MPANLNALIRYKQIDRCLRNPFVDCTIQKMQELCSEALGEFRGIYKQVSERTIRDDLRVMRSEMLGFNAPIKFKDGVYYYTDKNYSIFKIPVSEADLLEEIYDMLQKELDNLPKDKTLTIINRIAFLLEKKPLEQLIKEVLLDSEKAHIYPKKTNTPPPLEFYESRLISSEDSEEEKEKQKEAIKEQEISLLLAIVSEKEYFVDWADIFGLL